MNFRRTYQCINMCVALGTILFLVSKTKGGGVVMVIHTRSVTSNQYTCNSIKRVMKFDIPIMNT